RTVTGVQTCALPICGAAADSCRLGGRASRSIDRVLTEIMNAPKGNAGRDISAEQRWADDLLAASRLYRQDAIATGEQSMANVLDELERSLIEIVHSPAQISDADLEQIRRRIDAAALLFKIRVLHDELREREIAPAQPRKTT